MNVLIVSQCSKRALKETRRILDQFAERRGDRTWQTPITMAGLVTLRKLLKKSARRNTAIACHWIRGKDHSELMWIVGNASQFNSEGAVPTNTTTRDILRAEDENHWHTAEAIALLAGIAGLFHDFGKANKLFQAKLEPDYKGKISEPIRHEWVSLRLFQAFVSEQSDKEWLEKLSTISPDQNAELINDLKNVKLEQKVKRNQEEKVQLSNPFKFLAKQPVASVVAWLIVSHHRLPEFPEKARGARDLTTSLTLDRITELTGKAINAGWNSPQLWSDDWGEKEWQAVWQFPDHTPIASKTWCQKANSLGKRALSLPPLFRAEGWLTDRFSCHLARMVLMLSDHAYSATKPTPQWQDKHYRAVANTDRETGQPKQQLDEHNVGVGHNAYLFAKRLPGLRKSLPALSRMKVLKQRVSIPRFSWQNKAYELARALADKSQQQGFFGINMASTGCGKTFANARIMYGLSNERTGCRFSVALGLRTLTLQTGDAFMEKLRLEDDDLAVLVGSQAVRKLHQQKNEPEASGETLSAQEQKLSLLEQLSLSGSESEEALIDGSHHVRYEGSLEDGLLSRWLQQQSERKSKVHQLVSAPVLVSTIDYLMPATEARRGGKQIAPMLRLLTSDLVLDEPDDFGLEDLPALCRLVNWAGMLGSRVLLSSATLPPDLIRALYLAYLEGRNQFNKACGHQPDNQQTVPCAWFDEFSVDHGDFTDDTAFAEQHLSFVKQRIKNLQAKSQPLRWAELLKVQNDGSETDQVIDSVAQCLHQAMISLHQQHHSLVKPTDRDALADTKKAESVVAPANTQDKKVSFGLIRMANINPMVAVAQQLLAQPMPDNYRLHFVVYHSQYPLLMRSNIETVLDRVLNRNDAEAVWQDKNVKPLLDKYPEQNHLFVVLGTAVTEVGRDHDYDWAIAEPSSMRSLIQLAGRIMRHRRQQPKSPNLLILNKNIRALKGSSVAYTRPGFESSVFNLISKDLTEILQTSQYQTINAEPRILPAEALDAQGNLVDLEHAHLNARLFGHEKIPLYAARWWQQNAHWNYEIQRRSPFRQSTPDECFVLHMEDEQDEPVFYEYLPNGEPNPRGESFNQVKDLKSGPGVSPWINNDPAELIIQQAEHLNWPLVLCSRVFAEIRLREKETQEQWFYHPLLGVFGTP